MIDFDLLAYAMLGLSVLVSAAQIGGWALNADPRVIVNAGRWSGIALAACTPLVLLWLVISGRSTLAIMLAAFVLPVFVQGAQRWRSFLPRSPRSRFGGCEPPSRVTRSWPSTALPSWRPISNKTGGGRANVGGRGPGHVGAATRRECE